MRRLRWFALVARAAPSKEETRGVNLALHVSATLRRANDDSSRAAIGDEPL